MTDDPFEELARLKTRLAELEAIAAQPRRAGIGDALADHYSPTRPPVDPARRKLENAARGFVVNDGMEQALRQRAKDPAAWSASMRAMGASELEVSLYALGRTAAIEIGAFVPTTPSTTTTGGPS